MATAANPNPISRKAAPVAPPAILESVKERVIELDRVLRIVERQDPSKLTAGDRVKAKEELVEYSVRGRLF
ncbi:hypothetical protein MD484_g8804, partial [Candolleomyces efflorescens]